ncbi:MAG: hypothetical protein LAN62_11565 [Acidobacteriia bacterium]|nr:hypothetical protein [Terriglobia bacterium]
MSQDQTASKDVRKVFKEAGFEVTDVQGGHEAFVVKKNNCAQLVERNAKGEWNAAGPPTFSVRGLDCELEDRGYQKFWFHNGRRFPARVNDLRTLHRFVEEVRSLLGLKSLYHESLGTTSARTVYDRLDGRPGDS